MANLYADEQFPYVATARLRALGHDVLTVQEAGKGNQGIPDDEVLRFATFLERAVLTLNRRDFVKLHCQDSNHAGIITCTDDADKNVLGERIHLAIQSEANFNQQLLRIVRPSR